MTDKEIINELVLMLTFDYADLISEADQEIIEQRLQKMGLQGERRWKYLKWLQAGRDFQK